MAECWDSNLINIGERMGDDYLRGERAASQARLGALDAGCSSTGNRCSKSRAMPEVLCVVVGGRGLTREAAKLVGY